MTEASWLECRNPTVLLNEYPRLSRPIDIRVLGLIASACCRRIDDLLCDERSRSVADTLGRLTGESELPEAFVLLSRDTSLAAETLPTAGELFQRGMVGDLPARAEASHAVAHVMREFAVGWGDRTLLAFAVAQFVYGLACARGYSSVGREAGLAGLNFAAESEAQAHLVREILGNPYRPVHHNPDWSTDGVMRLAQFIHANGGFDGLPALGDALEEAGCDQQTILDHCRGSGDHVPGCWALETVIGLR